ncbi:hypothetical protein [Fusibacter ferrireducens]|uniref:HTH merR-type domain-containing protein n=1 Tax=Fusibacter ferrireducens TaxID=2785058 RepID=A0ABR9ZZ61_9FIRM|nr:hypothetical protein [Fusibacter ferrireducens]MBF4695448.1 hypothetical protein [Fusibacter ferrireducens]
MYKVSEAADIIGVEKVEIFEKMITHKALLDPNISKQDGVTYFDERGLEILKTLFHSSLEQNQDVSSEDVDIIKDAKPNKLKSRQDKEYDILKRKLEIITDELLNLDQELEVKDELVAKYQFKLLEDLDVISKLQYGILKKFERSVE